MKWKKENNKEKCCRKEGARAPAHYTFTHHTLRRCNMPLRARRGGRLHYTKSMGEGKPISKKYQWWSRKKKRKPLLHWNEERKKENEKWNRNHCRNEKKKNNKKKKNEIFNGAGGTENKEKAINNLMKKGSHTLLPDQRRRGRLPLPACLQTPSYLLASRCL